ncbi:group II intron reverse transcriptase/maturase [Laceyella putida]|uniref:Group II intron reverse transcriptase/maturase n=1 Tax=Laceyella putida TaxID=110101 RepID=A0ABW2RPL8_9BACL
MNQELKLKWHSIFGQILFERKLHQAWEQVKKNGGAGGIDGETIESYEMRLNENLDSLLRKLKAREYKPSPVRRRYIPKKNGKLRPLGIPNIEDRIVQQALVNILQPKCEGAIFHRWSCGYRPDRGVQRALQIILWNLEAGYNFVYDCDIRGFFDNISHKKLMKVLTKYIADGTVLGMIWDMLKAGYMEAGKYHETEAGTPQGGVISPLLANLFLNELDWKLEQHGIRFVRYADDFLLFAKTKEDIQKVADITKRTLNELGLEVAEEKTKVVDFNEGDFAFLGFSFEHWQKRKKDGKLGFIVRPTRNAWKDFRRKIKEKTRKTLTLNTKVWVERLNPVIRGKVNYFLNVYKAVEENKRYGQQSRCFVNEYSSQLRDVDGYIRRRLRVAMIHKHPSQRKGKLMTTKWNNEYFVRIGLIPAYWLYYNKQSGRTLEQYLDHLKARQRSNYTRRVYAAKAKGQEYFTPDRVRAIEYCRRAKN